MVEHIFRALLPEHGLMIREEQIMLCHEMLDTLFEGKIALCDAGVGIGKTHAYLAACLLWQRFRPVHLPGTVVLSTSSIALQGAIIACAFAGGDTGTPDLCSNTKRKRAVRMRSKACGTHGAGAHKNKCQQTAGGFASEFGKNI